MDNHYCQVHEHDSYGAHSEWGLTFDPWMQEVTFWLKSGMCLCHLLKNTVRLLSWLSESLFHSACIFQLTTIRVTFWMPEHQVEAREFGAASGMCSSWVPRGTGSFCVLLKLGLWLSGSVMKEYMRLCPVPHAVVSVRDITFPWWMALSAPRGFPSKAGSANSVLIVSLN